MSSKPAFSPPAPKRTDLIEDAREVEVDELVDQSVRDDPMLVPWDVDLVVNNDAAEQPVSV